VTDAAPLFDDVADGPSGGRAVWLAASDGVRIRAGLWDQGRNGTVFLFPGRTEYIEKYGRAAADLCARGYATLAVDWRGQGIAQRAYADRLIGHVGDFAEFQRDVDALIAFATVEGLPRPWYLLCHSMGGCIGLRSLMRGLPFKAAAFSAPMWGISMAAWMRPVAHVMGRLAGPFGQAHRYAPGTGGITYVLTAPFQGNVLTTDPEMWDYMRRQVDAHPDLALGGPSIGWLHAALRECGALAAMPAPPVPVLTALGTAEKVVDVAPIHLRMASWPQGRLDLYPGAEHEVPMETPDRRQRFFDDCAALFGAHR
jgi:lysophospholipase